MPLIRGIFLSQEPYQVAISRNWFYGDLVNRTPNRCQMGYLKRCNFQIKGTAQSRFVSYLIFYTPISNRQQVLLLKIVILNAQSEMCDFMLCIYKPYKIFRVYLHVSQLRTKYFLSIILKKVIDEQKPEQKDFDFRQKTILNLNDELDLVKIRVCLLELRSCYRAGLQTLRMLSTCLYPKASFCKS